MHWQRLQQKRLAHTNALMAINRHAISFKRYLAHVRRTAGRNGSSWSPESPPRFISRMPSIDEQISEQTGALDDVHFTLAEAPVDALRLPESMK